MTKNEPRPCPFCGGGAVIGPTFSGNGYVVRCHGLGCHVAPQTDAFDTIEEAVACWNGQEGEKPVGLIDPSDDNQGSLIVGDEKYDVVLCSHTSN